MRLAYPRACKLRGKWHVSHTFFGRNGRGRRYMVWCEPARGAARIRASVWLVTPSNRINGQADTKVTVTAQNVNEDECLFDEPLQW